MPFIGVYSDGINVWTDAPDGVVTMKEFKVNGHLLLKHNDDGVLEISASEESCQILIKQFGPLPIAKLVLPGPLGPKQRCEFINVTNIKSIPADNNEFLYEVIYKTVFKTSI